MPNLPPIPTVSLPRVPGLPDPLRRVHVPRDLRSVTTVGAAEVEAAQGDMSQAAVERIWRDVLGWYRSGVHPAIQVCVRRHGMVVLDRAIGHARGNGPRDGADAEKVPATPETPFLIYSGAKAITALVVHMLHERGLLDIHTPVSEYIPEYATGGKEGITIGHVLAHRAGVPNLPPEAFDLDRANDREYLLGLLCDARPVSDAGTRLAYHAVSGGYILAEVVWRVTGRDIRTVLRDEILDPLGFRWTNYGVDEADLGEVALNYVTGPPTAPPLSTMLNRALGLKFDDLVEATNDRRFLTAIVPSANTVTTANELSRFYEIFRRGGELEGVRVMSPETIRQATTEQSRLEVDWSLGFPTRFGYGLILGAQLVSLFGRDTQHAFGHLGFTNILAWADPERATSVAVLTSGKPVVYPELPRFYNLMQRITSEAPKVPRDEILI
ncbi:MAG TPA: serine hydrolase domain-containing protein [Thermoleophilaceae bacterium]